jgi:hypothetical protein
MKYLSGLEVALGTRPNDFPHPANRIVLPFIDPRHDESRTANSGVEKRAIGLVVRDLS